MAKVAAIHQEYLMSDREALANGLLDPSKTPCLSLFLQQENPSAKAFQSHHRIAAGEMFAIIKSF
jgi:hypothetical protein